MSTLILNCPSNSRKAALQRLSRVFTETIKNSASDSFPTDITLKGNDICINGTPIGNYLYISNVCSSSSNRDNVIQFDYGHNTRRLVSFATDMECSLYKLPLGAITFVMEFNKSNNQSKIIYES